MLTGFITIVVTMIILIAPIYIGLRFSKKSAQKRKKEQNLKK